MSSPLEWKLVDFDWASFSWVFSIKWNVRTHARAHLENIHCVSCNSIKIKVQTLYAFMIWWNEIVIFSNLLLYFSSHLHCRYQRSLYYTVQGNQIKKYKCSQINKCTAITTGPLVGSSCSMCLCVCVSIFFLLFCFHHRHHLRSCRIFVSFNFKQVNFNA